MSSFSVFPLASERRGRRKAHLRGSSPLRENGHSLSVSLSGAFGADRLGRRGKASGTAPLSPLSPSLRRLKGRLRCRASRTSLRLPRGGEMRHVPLSKGADRPRGVRASFVLFLYTEPCLSRRKRGNLSLFLEGVRNSALCRLPSRRRSGGYREKSAPSQKQEAYALNDPMLPPSLPEKKRAFPVL